MDRRIRFETMYSKHGRALRTFVHRRIDAELADDVVAEVFLVAWRRIDDAPADPLPWLISIARGVLANQRRGQARRSALHQRLVAYVPRRDLGPDDDGDGELAPAMRALSCLSLRDQELLLLVAWDGLSRGQAAAALGISTAQFAVRLHRARRRLQRVLDQEPPQRSVPARFGSTSEVS